MPFMATGSLDEISEPTVGHAVVAADMDHLIYDSSIDDYVFCCCSMTCTGYLASV